MIRASIPRQTPTGAYDSRKTQPTDPVRKPAHYQRGGIETIDYIRASLGRDGFTDYCIGNALKYLSRFRDKDGRQDLEKARTYLGWAIESHDKVVIPPPPNYNPDDVAFRKSALDELAAESQAWGMYDSPPNLRHIGIGDVPKAGRIVPIVGGAKAERDAKIEFNARWDRRDDRTNFGTAADSAYLASFSPNDGGASSGMADISCDGRGNVVLSGHARRKTDGVVTDVRYSATNAAISQHPMAAEALRDHDERLAGPESHL